MKANPSAFADLDRIPTVVRVPGGTPALEGCLTAMVDDWAAVIESRVVPCRVSSPPRAGMFLSLNAEIGQVRGDHAPFFACMTLHEVCLFLGDRKPRTLAVTNISAPPGLFNPDDPSALLEAITNVLAVWAVRFARTEPLPPTFRFTNDILPTNNPMEVFI